MNLPDILGAIRSRRKTLDELDGEIAKLESQRGQLLATPPDRSSVVAWALRAVDRAEQDFAKHLSEWYLAQENVAHVPGTWFDTNPGPRWLETQHRCPGVMEESHEGALAGPLDLDRKALMAILAPQLRESIPGWIEKHFPFKSGSLTTQERNSRLAAIDKKLSALFEEREKLAGELTRASSEIREILPE